MESFKKPKANTYLLKHFMLFFDEIRVDVKFEKETGLPKNTCKLVHQLCAFELSEDQVLRIENLLVNTASKLTRNLSLATSQIITWQCVERQ